MAFGLRPKETIAKGLTRSMQSELKRAPGEVKKLDAEGSVYTVRKRVKRTRALVRLVADELGKKTFAKIDARLHGSGKRLADLRDAEVLIATLGS